MTSEYQAWLWLQGYKGRPDSEVLEIGHSTEVIWSALHEYREKILGESEQADMVWDDICYAMAVMSEDKAAANNVDDSSTWQLVPLSPSEEEGRQ
jgi:hypothetical protein